MSPETGVDYEKFLSVFQPDDRDRILQMGTSPALPGNGAVLATEYRSVGVEDGKERWIAVRGRMLFDRENRATRLIGTTLDISERKRMEEDLRRRAEELQKIMDVAPVALFVAHDPDCHEVTGNRTENWLVEAEGTSVLPSAWRSERAPEVFSRWDRDPRSGTAPSGG
jgi:PAS domain-containing protein